VRPRGTTTQANVVLPKRGAHYAIAPRAATGHKHKVGARIERSSRARGLIVRNLGDCIAICPPYVMTE